MTRRTRTLLIRWSIFAILIAASVWSIVSIGGGTVPTSDAGMPWPLQDVRIPFHVMRWLDVPLAAPWVAAIFFLLSSCDHWETSEQLSPFQGRVALVGIISVIGLGIGAHSDAARQLETVFAGCCLFAFIGFLYALASRKVEKALTVLSLMLIVSIFILGILAGPFHALLWGLLEACSAAVGLSAGRLLRKIHFPLRAIVRWLSAHGIKDDPSVTRTAAAMPPRTTPVDQLVEFDRLSDQVTALQSRLEALRADPETAKYLALRAERPAA